MEIENQLPEKYIKNKNLNNKIRDEMENPQNKKIKKSKKSDFYDINDSINKDDKNKKRKNNTKKIYKVNADDKIIKKTKLKNIINKLNYLYLINVVNKYYQKWILQTFDIVEEDSESANDKEANKDKSNKDKEKNEEEEEEEEEEIDYGGDLEEIEERAPDEEESVITSVHSKTKVKRTNDILFALRKIIRYKNIFFRYFIRWYNAVDINAPTNEYKKIRKEKKLSNNLNSIKKNVVNANQNINMIELKNPIYEVSSEEKIEEPKSDVKTNLKNFIELKGTKKTILKKYYDIWYNLVFNQENSMDSNNNDQNEYIFTYHGNFRNKDEIISPKIKIKKQNLTDDNIKVNNKDKENTKNKVEGYNNKAKRISENSNNTSKKSKQKAQCYIRKKIYSIKKETKKTNKKKIKISDILKNLFIEINNKKLLFNALKKWNDISKKLDIGKVIFKKKQSTKIKKKISTSKSKKKPPAKKIDNNNLGLEEIGHKKNNLSLDEFINQKDKIKKLISESNKLKPNNLDDNQYQILTSESSPLINSKKYNNWTNNSYQINSDTSINNSINTNSNTSEMIDQFKDRDLKDNNIKKTKKTIKKEKKDNKGISGENELDEEEMEKIKKNLEKIRRIHKNQKAQRYLLIKPPKMKKNEKKKEDRQSFSSINYSLKLEKIQKKLLKLFLKTTCRQDSLMNNFDRWFNKTFNSKNYIPFIKKNLSNSTDLKVKKKISKPNKIKKTGKNVNDKKEVVNKKRDISVDNINSPNKKIKNKKETKNNENKNILHSFDLTDNDSKNDPYIEKNKDSENQENKNNDKYDKFKELLNQDFDSESSDNKLLFKEKKTSHLKNLSESFDAPSRKKSTASNKKHKKTKPDKEKQKIKDKDSKKPKEKRTDKLEESPRQRKPGKKSQTTNNEEELYENRYNVFEKNLDIDELGQNIDKSLEKIKNRKKQDLSSSVDIVLNKKNRKEKNIIHSRKKSKDDNNQKVNIKGINDYFKYKSSHYQKEEINPDVQYIEITQPDDSENEKRQKKIKKAKKPINPEEKVERRKMKLIKIYNKALHLLRKAIRSYKKRNKTFDPDYELARSFKTWISLVSNSNINDYKNGEKDENEEENEKENDENFEGKKLNALKDIFNIINMHNKKIKGRLSEDEENYNYIRYCYNIWFKNTFDSNENENDNDNEKNNTNLNDKFIESEKSNGMYYLNSNNMVNNHNQKNPIIEMNKDFNEFENENENESDKNEKKKNSKGEKNKEKKKIKHIESESLLEIDLEEKKSRKHKGKRRRNNKNNNSVNSNNSSCKKEEKEFDRNIGKIKGSINKFSLENYASHNDNQNNSIEKEEIRIKNIPKEEKPIEEYINLRKISIENDKINDIKHEEIKNSNHMRDEEKPKQKENEKPKQIINNIPKKQESIFQKIRKEFPLNNNDEGINTDYIKDKEEEDKKKIKKEEENRGLPPKIQAPPQVLALLKKQGKLNLPLPQQNVNPRLSFREFGKGNLEIVEPGELVSSERLKLVKKNLKRNLTSSTTFFEDTLPIKRDNTFSNKLIKSSYFKNDAFNLTLDKKKIDEINKKLYPIFEKKDEGIFNKKKYFNIWGSRTENKEKNEKRKKLNLNFNNFNIRPEVKKAKTSPLIFLTKSIQEDKQDDNDIYENDRYDKENENKENFSEKEDTTNFNNKDNKELDNYNDKNIGNNIDKKNNINNNKNNDDKNIEEKENIEINHQKNIVENNNSNPINNNNENKIIIKPDNINNIIDKKIASNESIEKINKEEKDNVEEDEEEEEEDEENEKEEKARNNKKKDIKDSITDNIQKEKDIKDSNTENIQKEKETIDNNQKKDLSKTYKNIIDFTDNSKLNPNYIINKDNQFKQKENNIDIKKDSKQRQKEKEVIIKDIYKKTKSLNKTYNGTFNIFKNNYMNNSTNELFMKEYSKLLDDQNKKIKAYQLYLFYTYFNENYEYYLLRNSFNKWKQNNNIFNEPCNQNHIKTYDDHCISCSCENDNCSKGQIICLNCNCDEIKKVMKDLLINYLFLKEMNPLRYYIYLWYKNVFFK